MWEEVQALIPPLVVGSVFVFLVIRLIRHEAPANRGGGRDNVDDPPRPERE